MSTCWAIRTPSGLTRRTVNGSRKCGNRRPGMQIYWTSRYRTPASAGSVDLGQMTPAPHARFLESHIDDGQPSDDRMTHTMTEPGAVGGRQNDKMRCRKLMEFRRKALMRSNSNDILNGTSD